MTFRDVSFAISDISDVSEIFPFLAWMIFAKRIQPYNLLAAFFLVSGLIKLFTLLTAEMVVNNMFAYHFLALLEIIMVYSFYSKLVFNKINYLIALGLVVLYAGNTLFYQSIKTFNSATWTLNSILIMVIGLSYFFLLYKQEEDTTPLETRPAFIITAGWLIYASGSLFSYLMGTDILSGKPEGFFRNAWMFECFSNILKNAAICYGFMLTKN